MKRKPEPMAVGVRCSPTVLLVEDNEAQRESYGDFLGSAGYTVHTTGSAREALEILAGKRFDLVIADFSMPEMDGAELIREIRMSSLPSGSGVPVILLTGCDDISEIEALHFGADAYCEKTRARTQLIPQVEFLLGGAEQTTLQHFIDDLCTTTNNRG